MHQTLVTVCIIGHTHTYVHCRYMYFMFITELPLTTSSDIPAVDFTSELTHSISKSSIVESSHTDHGCTSHVMTQVSKSLQ